MHKRSFKSRFEKYWFLRGFNKALLAIKAEFDRTKLEVLIPQMLWVGTWENWSPGNEGIHLVFHIHLEIRNDSAWASKPLWSDWYLINYGSALKRDTKKKKNQGQKTKTKSILRIERTKKKKKNRQFYSKGTGQKKSYKQEYNTRHK